MTRCTWPVEGRKDRQECGHRACNEWERDDERLPRCRKHVTREALQRAAEEGWTLAPAPA